MRKIQAATLEDIEKLVSKGCAVPGCTEDHTTMFLHSQCHVKSGVDVSYTKGSGVLTIVCKECQKPVAQLHIAKREHVEV